MTLLDLPHGKTQINESRKFNGKVDESKGRVSRRESREQIIRRATKTGQVRKGDTGGDAEKATKEKGHEQDQKGGGGEIMGFQGEIPTPPLPPNTVKTHV